MYIFQKLKQIDSMTWLYIVNAISMGGMFGSLYFSLAMDLTPCNLCIYQRILLYPIAIITTGAILKKYTKVLKLLPILTIPGMFLAGYQYLLQKTDLFEHSFINCAATNPCSEIDWQILGFVTIPLLAFLAFTTITLISFIAIKKIRMQFPKQS